MKIGIIGSGRVGFSIGKYLVENNITVVGYYDTILKNAVEAADFTNTDSFSSIEELVKLSDTLFITTPDEHISQVWDYIKELSIKNKIICHFSGSLSSVVFSQIEQTYASCCSIHPMLAFSDKFSSYKQLYDTFFTIEGQDIAVDLIMELFLSLGNSMQKIDRINKAKYHAAASILSNHVIAVLDTGYELLQECGFTKEESIKATSQLVRENVENVIARGSVEALTGPIERGDVLTVEKHLEKLSEEDKLMYQILGMKLVALAKEKHIDRDYSSIEKTLEVNK